MYSIMHMVISVFIKKYLPWLLILLSISVGQFLVLNTVHPAGIVYQAQMPQISTVMPFIGPIEYENNDPTHGTPFRWLADVGDIRVLGGSGATGTILSFFAHTGRSAGALTHLLITQQQRVVIDTSLSAGWRKVWILVPSQPWVNGYRQIHYQVTGDILTDRRSLGLAIQTVTIMPASLGHSVSDVLDVWLYVVLCVLAMMLIIIRQKWHWGIALAGVVAVLVAQVMWPMQWSMYVPTVWSGLAWGGAVALLWWAAPYRQPHIPLWSAVIGVIVALTCMRYGYAAIGAALLLGLWFVMPPITRTVGVTWEPHWWPWLFGGAVVFAVVLRTILLNDFPQGMFRDEARHGGLAQRVLAGEWMIYSPFANLPAGYFYLSALPIAILGPSAFAIRIVAAVVGSLTVAVAYWALYPWWGKSFALLMSIVLAPFLWHVGLSRIGFPATIGPLLTLSAVGLLWRGFAASQSRRAIGWGVGAGLATGAMTLAYHSARLMPLVVGLAIIAHWYMYRWHWRQHWQLLASWCVATAVAAAPIVWYAITQSYNYMKRIDITSLTGNAALEGVPFWVALQKNILAYAGMFLMTGDHNARHFFMGMAQLNIIEGLGFVVGLMVLWRRRDAAALWVAAYLLIAVTPGILSVDAPHALRTVEATIPTAMIVTYGLWILISAVAPRWQAIVVTGILCVSVIWSANTYLQWQSDQRTYGEFDGQLTNAIRYVQTTNDVAIDHATQWYLPLKWRNGDVGVYLLRGMTIASYDRGRIEPSTAPTKLFLLDAATSAPAQSQAVPLPASLAMHTDEFRLWCSGECSQLQWLP